MEKLSNQALIKTYEKARKLNLAEVFIQLIVDEMNKRNFTNDDHTLFREINMCLSTNKRSE